MSLIKRPVVATTPALNHGAMRPVYHATPPQPVPVPVQPAVDATLGVIRQITEPFMGIRVRLDANAKTPCGTGGYMGVMASPNAIRKRVIHLFWASIVPQTTEIVISNNIPRIRVIGLHMVDTGNLDPSLPTNTAPNLDTTALSLVAIQQIGIFQKRWLARFEPPTPAVWTPDLMYTKLMRRPHTTIWQHTTPEISPNTPAAPTPPL